MDKFIKILQGIFIFSLLFLTVSCVPTTPQAAPGPSQPAPAVSAPKEPNLQITGVSKDYDSTFVSVVETNWWNLVESTRTYNLGIGDVVLNFRLHSNGKITNMKVAKKTTGLLEAFLCEEAVLKGAPYPRWTEAMLKARGTNWTDAELTFKYEPSNSLP